MKKFIKWLSIVLGALVFIVLIAGVIVFRMPLPDHEIDVSGLPLNDFVEIIRDDRGVPHIYGTNVDDILFAQGYVHAQDRFWQLEFWSHLSTGRLASLIGEPGIGADLLFRTYGFNRVALKEYEEMSPEMKNDLIQYTKGINAYINSRSQRTLSLEHFFLTFINPDYVVDEYLPYYPLAWAKMMAYDLNGNYEAEIRNAKTYGTLSDTIDSLLKPPFPEKHPYIVEGWESVGSFTHNNNSNILKSLFISYATKDLRFTDSIGSNSWAISGMHTESGYPILANDPHLSAQLPPIWYENGLHCFPYGPNCNLDVVGLSFAGSPYVIIGHNSSAAWGFTNMGPDVQDLYIEKINPANPNQYEVDGEWVDMDRFTEIIYLPNQDPLVIEVRETHHGPVISDRDYPINNLEFSEQSRIELPSNYAISLSWTALYPGKTFQSIRDFNYMKNYEEFREATKNFQVPAQNLLYADIEGNIAYQSPGLIPIRAEGHSGHYPIAGWDSSNDWKGFVPFEELPYVLNPESGYIITANQSIHPDQPWSDSHNKGYRAQSIKRVIENNVTEKVSVEDVMAMQINNYDYSPVYILPYIFDSVYSDSLILNEMKAWTESENQFEMNIDSSGAAAWAVFIKNLVNETFEELIVYDGSGEEINLIPGHSDTTIEILLSMLKDPNHVLWDHESTPNKENLSDLLVIVLDAADKEITTLLGDNPKKWEWGEIHTITYSTNFLGQAGIPPLTALVDLGPFRVSGSANTINATGWSFDGDYSIADKFGHPSMRMIVDLSNFNNSKTVLPTGQSGHVTSKYYDDQVDSWISNEMFPQYYSREIVELNQKDVMYLRP